MNVNWETEFVKLLKGSSHTVILTGAGMSTESGVPDFRSKAGWWKNIDPLTVATVEALEDNYELFHEFYSTRISGLSQLKPNKGHFIIADWQKEGLVQLVATQNVDNFHQTAGAEHVQTLHGSIKSYRCNDCRAEVSETAFLKKVPCPTCGGRTRPNVVLFGEMLPQESWQTTLANIEIADLVIVIGTSLEVYPVNQLPAMTNGKTVFINLDEVRGANAFDLTIKGKAGEVLERVDELLRK
ncbi:NAD-dependent deacylase [Bacillus alkalicola]|uniref:protein acetyllysine N-acetyltransferase n=2 Tax=Bacillales TaxID=1385 RepID=A0ABS6JZ27_9BACI|nr:NAD-dependent deacylase [Bacillus alkalicola]